MPPQRNGKSHDPLAGSLFLLQSAMLDHSREGVTRASLEAANAVAAAYWRSGRHAEARDLLERTLADCRAVLGPRDPDTWWLRATSPSPMSAWRATSSG